MFSEFLPIGTKLIAKTECEMIDGSGSALKLGKQYSIIAHSKKSDEIVIKSEICSEHHFHVDPNNDDYWGHFFEEVY